MSHSQPRRWTASTVIALMFLFLLADYLVFHVALPVVCQLAVGAVLGIAALATFVVVLGVVFSVALTLWEVLTEK